MSETPKTQTTVTITVVLPIPFSKQRITEIGEAIRNDYFGEATHFECNGVARFFQKQEPK